jgi:transcriptional regulator with XRE-family HTH domain
VFLWKFKDHRMPISDKELGEQMGLSQATVSRLLAGDPRVPKEPTLKKIADWTDVPITTIRALAHRSEGQLGPWQPSKEVDQLPREARELLDKAISVMLGLIAERVTR